MGPSSQLGRGIGSRARRAVRLGWRHRADVAAAVVMLPTVAMWLRRDGLAGTMDRLDRRSTPPGGAADVELARDVGFAVRVVARVVPDATCLRTTLVQHDRLRARGIPSTVRLGARRAPAGGDLAFHAWLEVAGEPVSELPSTVAGYVPFDDGPPPGSEGTPP